MVNKLVDSFVLFNEMPEHGENGDENDDYDDQGEIVSDEGNVAKE